MKKILAAPIILGLAALTGCATSDGYYGSTYNDRPYYGDRYDTQRADRGRVVYVRDVELRRDRTGPGAGAVVGAIAGGVLGSQIGSGSGRTAATIGGAVAGGYVGDRIQRNNQSGYEWGQEIQVRLDNGQTITVIQPGDRVYNGALVRITGSGSGTRVQVIR